MFRLFRRRRLAAGSRPPLEPDERIVGWAATTDRHDVVVVTNRGVWLPGASSRLGWHEIHKAIWSGRQLTLVAAHEVDTAAGYTVVADLPATVHMLTDPGNVPGQVRTRVTRSIAYTRHHPVPGGGGLRLVARRVPGVDGLRWSVRYDDGTDRDDLLVRAATADLVAEGRASVEAP